MKIGEVGYVLGKKYQVSWICAWKEVSGKLDMCLERSIREVGYVLGKKYQGHGYAFEASI